MIKIKIGFSVSIPDFCGMAEDIQFISGTKEEQYQALIPQIKALLQGEQDIIANVANVIAVLKFQFNFLWVGFYRVVDNELLLGPFQGPVACTRIKKGKGVCGACWEREKTIVVPDVDKFLGHIACSTLSRSEIVVPVIRNGVVIGVLDIDSEQLNTFDEIDRKYLEQVCTLL